jgi:predicted PurR-regulated permease PerM
MDRIELSDVLWSLLKMSQIETHWRRDRSFPITIVLVLLAIGFIYWASPVLVPLALSVLLAFLLNPLVTYLQRRGMPRSASAFLVTTVAVGLIGGLGWIFTSQLANLAEQLPEYERRVTTRIEEIRESGQTSLLNKVQGFIDRVSLAATRRTGIQGEETPQPVVLVGEGGRSLTPMFSALGPVMEPLAAIGLVIVQLIYLLIDTESIRDRFLRLAGQGNMPVTTRALDEASNRISRYLIAQFILNAAFGLLVTLGLWLFGVPHAPLCGLMAAFFRYIPYVGPWLAAILPLMLSLMTTDGWFQPIGVALVFGALELTSNLVVEPIVYGRSIGVSQSSLIIAIAFWAWMWGPMGLVLAAPLTVCLAIIGKYVPSLKFFDVLLGDSPALSPDVRFYQRLLAHDDDGAFQVVNVDRGKQSLISLFDRILVPALCSTKRDVVANRLDEDQAGAIAKIVSEIGEELAATQHPIEAEAENPAELSTRPVRTLLCAMRPGADEAAVKLLSCVTDPNLIDLEWGQTNRLASEITALAVESQISLIGIIAIPPGGLSRTRLLCKRLRESLPEAKIVVGRWGHDAVVEENNKQILNAGADSIASTLEETSSQLVGFARLMRPLTPSAVAAPHFDVPKNATLSSS